MPFFGVKPNYKLMLRNVISDNLVVAAEREALDPCYWSQNRPAEKHPKVKIDNSELI